MRKIELFFAFFSFFIFVLNFFWLRCWTEKGKGASPLYRSSCVEEKNTKAIWFMFVYGLLIERKHTHTHTHTHTHHPHSTQKSASNKSEKNFELWLYSHTLPQKGICLELKLPQTTLNLFLWSFDFKKKEVVDVIRVWLNNFSHFIIALFQNID